MRNHFAIRFGDPGERRRARRRTGRTGAPAFNSPFWPFVLTSTSVGQEGLDFHAYCHAVVHWNLPVQSGRSRAAGGPRASLQGTCDPQERRSRLTGARRSTVATGTSGAPFSTSPANARPAATGSPHSGIFPLTDGAHIERHVPALPLSRDARQLEALKRSLAVYRMVFGQPRQDDLMAFLLDRLTCGQLAEIRTSPAHRPVRKGRPRLTSTAAATIVALVGGAIITR